MNKTHYISNPHLYIGLSLVCSIAQGYEPIIPEPEVATMIHPSEMPQRVELRENVLPSTDAAVESYHDLRKTFKISHTEMGKWLGVKRRSLYNWLNEPSSSIKYRAQIEDRLSNLTTLKNEMEPEHWQYLYKIAFSPIYGNKKFGKSIVSGSSDQILSNYYDDLFGKFESYRKNMTN